MKEKALKIINLIVAALVCAFAIGYAFAWLAESRRTDGVTFNGSSGQTYFAGGDGTSDDPYLITDKYHLYNLAWLQNTGKLTTKYYFELDADLIIPENFWLPPIGTDDNPFNGDFNGNGHTISGLKITTDTGKLSQVGLPSGYKAFSNAVGMFGMTDSKSEIHNFILEKPIVEAATANATYSQSSERYIGIAVGMVSGKAYSIGVLAEDESDGSGAQLLLNRTGYSTFNSIIGKLGENVTSSVTGGGSTGSGGSGSSFGASFDVEGMYTRLTKIAANKASTTPSWKLPNLDTATNESIVLESLEKLPFTVTNDYLTDTSTDYSGSGAVENIASDNIGYLLGNQNKVYNKTLTFGGKLVETNGSWAYSDGTTPANGTFPSWIYTTTATEIGTDVYSSSNGFAALTTLDDLPDGIKDLIPETSGKSSVTSVRLSQTYQNAAIQIYAGTNSNGQWSPHGQIIWMGNTYGEGLMKGTYTDPVVNQDGIYLTEDGYLLDDSYYTETNQKYYIYYLNTNNEKIYFPASDSWDSDLYPIYGIDANGYAKNKAGVYYDSSGNLINEDGYAYNELGFIISNVWPLADTYIGEDGYLYNNTDNEPYKDADGTAVYAYGYDKDENGYLIYKSGDNAGQKVSIAMGGWSFNPQARTGTYVSAKTGNTCEFYRYTKGIALPNCGIWFKPSQAGTIRLVMYAETAGDGFALIKGKRTSATKANPFIVDYTKAGSDVEVTEVGKYRLPSNVLFYFEFEVSAEDIADGRVEYWLMQYGGGGAYFVYMDLGASAADNTDTSTVTSSASVSAVDFIYKGVEISQNEETTGIAVGNFIITTSGNLYEATGTSVYFENLNTILQIVFVRPENGKNDSGYTLIVTVSSSDGLDEITQTKTTASISGT